MDIDFTEEYSPGMYVYYAFHNKLTGTKKVYKLKITKVYPNMIFAWEEKGCAYMIGIEDEENLYTNQNIAQAFLNQL
jgi:hypothetical protein